MVSDETITPFSGVETWKSKH